MEDGEFLFVCVEVYLRKFREGNGYKYLVFWELFWVRDFFFSGVGVRFCGW